MPTNILFASPGQQVQINLSLTNATGAPANSPTTPQILRIILPNISLAANYPQDMTQIDTGLYYFRFTLPTGATAVGSYLADVQYTDPSDGLLKVDLWQVAVSAPYGHYFASTSNSTTNTSTNNKINIYQNGILKGTRAGLNFSGNSITSISDNPTQEWIEIIINDISSSVNFAGDLTGNNTTQTVIGLQSRPVSSTVPSINQVLAWSGSQWTPTNLPSSLPPSGPAGGDLSVTYPNPIVAKIQANPVSAIPPAVDQVLRWSGTEWIPSTISTPPSGAASGDLTSFYPSPVVAKIRSNPVIAETLGATQDGYVLTWKNTDGYWRAQPSTASSVPTGPAGGDLISTYPNPTVAKIKGNPVATETLTVTQDGYALTWSNTDGYWAARPASTPDATTLIKGKVKLANDLAGTADLPVVNKIKGNPVASETLDASRDGYVLSWSNTDGYWASRPNTFVAAGTSISVAEAPDGYFTVSLGTVTQDQILPAYAITLTLVPASLRDVSETVITPAFTATYNRTPSTAVLTDNIPNAPTNVISTPTSFSSPFSFVKSTVGGSVTWTLTSNEGGPNKTATQTMTWTNRIYYGVSTIPGSYSAAFITGLPTSVLATSRNRTFAVTAGAGEYIYYCFRSAYGTPTFTVGGFSGGFHLAASSVSVTNAFGFTESFDIWESDNASLGSTTVVVT